MEPEYETTLTAAPDRPAVEAIGQGLAAFNRRRAGEDGRRISPSQTATDARK